MCNTVKNIPGLIGYWEGTCLIFFRLVILNFVLRFEVLFGRWHMLPTILRGRGVLLLAESCFIAPRCSRKQAFQNEGLDRNFSQEWVFCVSGNMLRNKKNTGITTCCLLQLLLLMLLLLKC